MIRNVYNAEIPQCLPDILPAGPNSERPTMKMDGAIVSGVM